MREWILNYPYKNIPLFCTTHTKGSTNLGKPALWEWSLSETTHLVGWSQLFPASSTARTLPPRQRSVVRRYSPSVSKYLAEIATQKQEWRGEYQHSIWGCWNKRNKKMGARCSQCRMKCFLSSFKLEEDESIMALCVCMYIYIHRKCLSWRTECDLNAPTKISKFWKERGKNAWIPKHGFWRHLLLCSAVL